MTDGGGYVVSSPVMKGNMAIEIYAIFLVDDVRTRQ